MINAIAIYLLFLVALSSTSVASTIHHLQWDIESTSGSLTGHALYIAENDSMFRIEISTQPTTRSTIFDNLLSREGQGWTITPSLNKGAVLQPWSGQFSELDRAQYSAIITLLEILQTSDENLNSFRVTLRAPIFYEDSISVKPAELLNRMRIRGAGKGASEEVWSVVISGQNNSILAISSNRTPASLRITKIDSYPVSDNIEMLFVPVWSLENLISGN
ncbi:MAG: hypothetical protein GY752_07495 [bacterium]|nr:hypothetical protein [bacterium]MCP4799833.1 hypothetical protein [bacterium]